MVAVAVVIGFKLIRKRSNISLSPLNTTVIVFIPFYKPPNLSL